jgi:phosphoesterase RecJ-like protein
MKDNNKYKTALNLILNSRYILIVTHINPDPDTISCALALGNYCFENKIKHKVFNKQNNLPSKLDYLNRFDKITDVFPPFYDLAIYVDCGDIRRADIDIADSCKIINIDHHQSNDNFGVVNFVDDTKASTAEVLYDFFIQNDMDISKNTAMCLYTGIYSDSIGFTTPRTTQDTFQVVNHLISKGLEPSYIASMLNQRESLAKYRLLPKILDSLELHNEGKIATIYLLDEWLKQTGASYMDCEDAVNMVLNISVVQIAIFLRVSKELTRVSLRSKKDDVSQIANQFDGGGHKNAAGCKINTTDITEAKKILLAKIKDL